MQEKKVVARSGQKVSNENFEWLRQRCQDAHCRERVFQRVTVNRVIGLFRQHFPVPASCNC